VYSFRCRRASRTAASAGSLFRRIFPIDTALWVAAAKVRHPLFIDLLGKSLRGLLPEERGEPISDDLEDQVQVLAHQLVVRREFIPDGAERTARGRTGRRVAERWLGYPEPVGTV
jgi:hypothetical protein